MKIGVSSYSFSRYMATTGADYFEICKIAKSIGFEAIEFINLNVESSEDERASRLELARRLKKYCDELGIEIVAYTVGADLVNKNPDESFDELVHCLDVALCLGAKILRHDVAYKLIDGMTYKDVIRIAAPQIREITKEAQVRGIRTSVENHGWIIQAPEIVEELIREVNHPNFGWLCDIGNFLCADCDPLASVRIAAKYTLHAHAKDFYFKPASELPAEGFRIPTNGGNSLKGTVVGNGVVPVKECIDVLRDAGYDGVLSLEFEGTEDPIEAIKTGYERLKEYIS